MDGVVITKFGGRPAVAAADRNANRVTVWTQDRSGGEFAPTSVPVGIQPTSIVAADLAGDRDADFATVNLVTSDITLVTTTR